MNQSSKKQSAVFLFVFVLIIALSVLGRWAVVGNNYAASESNLAHAGKKPNIADTLSQPSAVQPAAPTISLTIWADNTRTPALRSVAQQFQAELGVTVVIEEIGFGDIRGLFTQAAPAGEGPDIIVGAHDWLGELVVSGLLAPIDLGDKLDDFAPAALQAFSYDGKLYGMPNAQENVAFFINGDILDECPATWSEVKEISAEIAANNTGDIDQNLYGFVRMEGDPFHFLPIQTAFGGYVFGLSADGSYNPYDVGIDSAGSIAAATWWASMVNDALQPPAVDWDTMHTWFEEGKSAMTITGPWALPRLRDSGVNYQICDIPDETADGRPFLGALGFMVSAFSTDPLLAQIFLTDYVATLDVMAAMYAADPRVPAYLPVMPEPDLAAFRAVGTNGMPMPAIPEMRYVWEPWGNAIVLIAQKADTPENAFKNAADRIRQAIGVQPSYPLTIYLPLLMYNHIVYFEGPWEREPNNSYLQANGPLRSGRTYFGYPDDEKDYFSVYLHSNSRLTIDLANHTAGAGAQLLLYRGIPQSGRHVGSDSGRSPLRIAYDAAPGQYYIYIFTASGHHSNEPYTLTVTYDPLTTRCCEDPWEVEPSNR